MLGAFHGRDGVALVRQAVIALATFAAIVFVARCVLKVLWLLAEDAVKHFLVPNRILAAANEETVA